MQEEHVTAAHSNGAAIIKAKPHTEHAEAHGTYHVVCTGPVERHREQYNAIKERLARTGVRGWLDRCINGGSLRALLSSIPMEEKWAQCCPNVVTTLGKNLALDAYLGGSGYSVTGPYLFLIGAGASSAVAGDTMGTHAGWQEVGAANAPFYNSPATRRTVSWSAAASGQKVTNGAISFSITGTGGTVGGCGLVLGTGASSTIDNPGGTLYSAGQFVGGNQAVNPGDTLAVTYTAQL